MRIPREMECYRRPHPMTGDIGTTTLGIFKIPARRMTIMATAGWGWEHVSVSHPDAMPTWDEMEWAKRTFWDAEDTVMQLHVPVAEHRNHHQFCLHLWRPLDIQIPRPPSYFVA